MERKERGEQIGSMEQLMEEKWTNWDGISINGLIGMVHEHADYSSVLISDGPKYGYRGLYGAKMPSPDDPPNPFKDLYFALDELVKEGFFKAPEQGDDAGSMGSYFWQTNMPKTVKEIVRVLREKGFDVKKRQ